MKKCMICEKEISTNDIDVKYHSECIERLKSEVKDLREQNDRLSLISRMFESGGIVNLGELNDIIRSGKIVGKGTSFKCGFETDKTIIANINLRTPDWHEFVEKLGYQFDVLSHTPTDSYYSMSFDGFHDWMTDLNWLDQNKNIEIRVQGVISDDVMEFLKYVKEFWENDAERCIVGGKNRKCTIYINEDELQ